jgi:hypothetical protein
MARHFQGSRPRPTRNGLPARLSSSLFRQSEDTGTGGIYRAEGVAQSSEKLHSFCGHSHVSIFWERSTSAR